MQPDQLVVRVAKYLASGRIGLENAAILRFFVPQSLLRFGALYPTGCATCTTFRHRHFSLSRLIETAEIKVTRREDKPGDQEEAERIQ